MAAQQSHDSFPSSIPANFEVFLSFRGTDTRKNFTDHLYNALNQAGVRTFRDNEELEKGESIEKSLPKAIQESKISIPVFSRNYASSKWCLDELVKIMECKEKIGQKVLPIFLDDASPSDVRKQTGSFAKAFEEHEMRFAKERVDKWREALRAAGELSGYNSKEVANGHESNLIKNIVEKVLSELNDTHLDVSEHLVGIDSRVNDMIGLLNIEHNDVRIVGICGMGGIGKTTVAKAVYNQIFNCYDGSSFLESVRDISQQPNGLVYLQNQLHFDILKRNSPFISSVSRGINVINKRFCAKKILVILDDVDQEEQLDALAGGRDWFGLGSRIIITTRDERLLRNLVVDEIYKPEQLDSDQSLLLFSKHAFGRDKPLEDYMELSMDVARIARGLPMALKVLGSSLIDNRVPTDWEETLEKLRKIPPVQVQKKLKISYDLLDEQEKDIFLDIACFFIRMDKRDAIEIFKACGFSANIGINTLIRKSLVKINDNKLIMHDLLRDMGRQIVREESLKEPGMRSRLWVYEEVLDVLKRHSGSRNVEGILFNFEEKKQTGLKEGHFSAEAFLPMSKLRLLRVTNAGIKGNFEHLSKELRWLCWQGCPLKSIPANIHLEKLVVLDLQYSNITQLWNGWHQNKVVEKLKVLNLSHCYSLTKTPDFSGLPSLERLILVGCTGLVEIHESIGHLEELAFLNLKGCNNLVDLPSSIWRLRSLESLILSNCSKISSLPGNIGNMGGLTELLLDNTAIEQLPDSIGLLKNLKKLYLGGGKSVSRMSNLLSRSESPINLKLGLLNSIGSVLKSRCSSMWFMRSLRKNLDSRINTLPASFSGLCSLQELNLSKCNISEGAIPCDFGSLSSLKFLDLGYNNFCSLPASISRLSRLEILNLPFCTKLQSLPEDFGRLSSLKFLNLDHNNFFNLPTSIPGLSRLDSLFLAHCKKLQSLPVLPCSLRFLDASGCVSIESLPNLSNLEKLEDILIPDCENLADIQGLERLDSLKYVLMAGCSTLANTMRRKGLVQGISERVSFLGLPGSEVPEWFSHQNSLTCVVPTLYGREIEGLIVCLVFAPDEMVQMAKVQSQGLGGHSATRGGHINVDITRNDVRLSIYGMHVYATPKSHNGGTCFYHLTEHDYDTKLEEGDQIHVSISERSCEGFQFTKGGIHLVYKPKKGFEPIIEDITTQQASISDSLSGFLGSSSYAVNGGSHGGAKRGRHDNEAGPSNGWSIEERTTKRLRIEFVPPVDLEEEQREGWLP